MGCCCCKKKDVEEYTLQQVELLREKIRAYSDGKINRYNIVRNIAYGMSQLVKVKLAGKTKREILTSLIMDYLDSGAFPQELVKKIIENIIDDIYISFRKNFKGKCC